MDRRLGIILLPAIILAVWEILAVIVNNPFFLPRLETVVPVLANPFSNQYTFGTGSIAYNASRSLQRVILGFLIATAVAVPIGILMGRSERISDYLDSTIQLLRPVPPLAWLPLALAWFRIGLTSIVFIIFIGAFFPILLNTIDGVKGIKNTWLEVAWTLGARERQVLGKVVLPAAAPTIWTGLRVGFGIAWMSVVAAEMLPGVTSGLGYLILTAYNFGQMQVTIAGMIVIGVIGLSFDFLFKAVERRWFGWRGLER